MSVVRLLVLSALFASLSAAASQAQSPSTEGGGTITIGRDVKRTVGTITGMAAGDVACYLTLKDDRGARFEEMAAFDICEQRALIGRRVSLTYDLRSVMAPECQGDPNCKKVLRAIVVIAVRPLIAGATSLCAPDEVVVFSCRTGDKTVSVCAARGARANQGYLQYRFGRPAAGATPEFVLPEEKKPPAHAASGRSVPFAGGGGAWLRFGQGAHDYIVYTGIGRWGPDGAVREKSGIVVEQAGKPIASPRCSTRPLSLLGPDWFEQVGLPSGRDFDFPD
ncbi:MAG: hypothetical protein FJX11_03970 [Alphaproteobacteria bacterium]|nr:hypothetical protein [Alphaproteobacteria bacterium]